MSIGKRLALSFSIIFLLFAANLAINWWGSSQRAKALYQLRNAVDRQLLASQIDQAFDQRKKEISIFHKLRVQIGAKALNKAETEDIVAKLDRINHLVEQARRRTDSRNAADINSFIILYDKIHAEWLQIYTSKNLTDFQQTLPDDIVEKATLTITALKNSEEKTVLVAARNDEEKAALVQRLNLIIFTISTFLAMLVSWLLIHYLRSNIHTLKYGAEAFGKGHLDEQIDIEGDDDFGDLANSFNHMATKLKTAIDEANIARDEAENANQSKSSFLANMSHELRTPMNAIIGYSEILIEDAEAAGVKEFEDDLHKICSAGKHLLSLINDVLDISKIESGKMTVFLEFFDLQELINDIVSTIQPLIEQNNNQLEVHINPLPSQMYADSTKIRQILFNLLSNASKFTENGKITLSVN
ncbi:MAG: histidine kinase dimerization/phospho-acceptor domain-containing protein, partial [Methylococcales bacterium]